MPGSVLMRKQFPVRKPFGSANRVIQHVRPDGFGSPSIRLDRASFDLGKARCRGGKACR